MRRLAEAAAVAEPTWPGATIDQQLIVGAPVAVLGAEAERAQLLVLGDRGRGAVAGLRAGSVAVALSAHAACPVVLVRTAKGEPVEDRSGGRRRRLPVSENALAFAFDAASVRSVPLVAVHTWWDLLVDETMAPLLDWPAIEAEEGEVLAERLAGWGEKYPDVPVRRRITRDHPAHTLIRESQSAQLVASGRAAAGRWPPAARLGQPRRPAPGALFGRGGAGSGRRAVVTATGVLGVRGSSVIGGSAAVLSGSPRRRTRRETSRRSPSSFRSGSRSWTGRRI